MFRTSLLSALSCAAILAAISGCGSSSPAKKTGNAGTNGGDAAAGSTGSAGSGGGTGGSATGAAGSTTGAAGAAGSTTGAAGAAGTAGSTPGVAGTGPTDAGAGGATAGAGGATAGAGGATAGSDGGAAAGTDGGAAGSNADGGDSSTDPAEQFVGTWHYDQATGAINCPGSDPIDETPAGNATFGVGISAPLVDLTTTPVDPGTFCNTAFDVDGPEATARTDGSCVLTGGDTLTVDMWTFTLTSATTAEEKVAETIHITNTTTTCAFTSMAVLTRISKD